MGYHLRALGFTNGYPYSNFRPSCWNFSCPNPGSQVELLQMTLQLMNSTASIVEISSREQDEALEMLYNDTADITTITVSITNERMKKMDFSIPICYYYNAYIAKEIHGFRAYRYILSAISESVLLMLFVTGSIVAFLLLVYSRLFHHLPNKYLQDWVFLSWRVILTQPSYPVTSLTASRILICTWMFFCLIIATYYQTKLNSLIAISRKTGVMFNTLDGVINAVKLQGYQMVIRDKNGEQGVGPYHWCTPKQCAELEKLKNRVIKYSGSDTEYFNYIATGKYVGFATLQIIEDSAPISAYVYNKSTLFIKDANMAPMLEAFAINKKIPGFLEKFNRAAATTLPAETNIRNRYFTPLPCWQQEVVANHVSSFKLYQIENLIRLYTTFIGFSMFAVMMGNSMFFKIFKVLLLIMAIAGPINYLSNSAVNNHESREKRDLEKFDKKKTVFRKRPETQHVQCGLLLRNQSEYVEYQSLHRVKMVSNPNLNMSCTAIRERISPKLEMRQMKFGVAIIRNVFKDYELIEDQLRAGYHPQNIFCFSIDLKSPNEFKMKIGMLASCFPNVFVSTVSYDMLSSGHYTNHAHLECLRIIIKHTGWNYVLVLQNHDILLKSPYEMVEIYDHLHGSNDMQLVASFGQHKWNSIETWTPLSLSLFLREDEIPTIALLTKLTIGKGAVQLSLTRDAVYWMTHSLNLTQIMSQFNEIDYGVDEQLFQTLHMNSQLGMPGGFVVECMKNGNYTGYISRFNAYGSTPCLTKHRRHYGCIFGVEDLPRLSKVPHLTANKVLPEFDYGIIDCIHELIFNRTFLGQIDHELDIALYERMPSVIYNRNKLLTPNMEITCATPV